MAKYRKDRIQESVKVAVSEVLASLRDPRLGFVTITDVDLSNDMSYAKIYVSILGGDDEKKQTMEALSSAKGFVRTSLGQKVKLRIVPNISFVYDDSIERGSHLMKLFAELEKE